MGSTYTNTPVDIVVTNVGLWSVRFGVGSTYTNTPVDSCDQRRSVVSQVWGGKYVY